MKFLRKTAGLTLWDHQRNEEILKTLKVEPIFKFIQNYRANWREHIERMDSSRIPINLLNYRPYWKRSLGRPLKRWSETVTGRLAYYLMKKKKTTCFDRDYWINFRLHNT
jgi:hypothetical protein